MINIKQGIIYLFTYFIGHNNPINWFWPTTTHSSRRLCSLRQLITAVDNRASSIWSFQRIQGRPLGRIAQISASNTRLAGASSFIRTTWSSQRSRWILIRCTTYAYDRTRKSSPTRTGPKILQRTFFSYTLKVAASVPNSIHASAPQRSTGTISIL